MGLKKIDYALIIMFFAAAIAIAMMVGKVCHRAFQPILQALGG